MHRVTIPIRTRSNAQKTHIYFVKAAYNISHRFSLYLHSNLKQDYFFVFQGGGTQEYREYFKFRQRRKAEKESV